MAEQLNLQLLPRIQVKALDTSARRLRTASGDLAYGQLVLAVGADPLRLPLAGDAADEVLSVNHLDDYARFRAALEGRRNVLIIGAGLIGCEFANDLSAAGYAVRVVDPARRPLASLAPEAIGRALAASLQAQGVRWHFGRGVKRLDRAGDCYVVTLDDDTLLAADVVLSAIGLRPRTSLAAAAGLAVERGIVVDAHLRSSAPGVYAIGDCAQYEGRVLPFVLPIMNAAKALAATLNGTPTPVAFPAMPVAVKTPALPIIVCPPAAGTPGAWREQSGADGIRMTHEDESGRLAGFALSGVRTGERMALTRRLA